MMRISSSPTQRRLGRGLVLGLFALFAAAPAVFAQQPRTITLDEAVRIALEQNVLLKQAENQADLRATDVAQRRANFLPNLSLSSNAGRNYGRQFDQTRGEIVNEATQSMSLGASTNLNLFNGFEDVSALRQSRLQSEASDLSYDRTRQSVAYEVLARFLQVIVDRDLIGIQEENLESQRQQLARIEELTRVGARPVSDLYQQQANVASSELDLLNAQSRLELDKTRLIQTLHLDPFGDYEFVAPSIEDRDFSPEQYDLNRLLNSAFDQRVDLRAQEMEIDAARAGIQVARAGYYPSVGLNLNYGSRYSSGFSGATFGDQVFDLNRGGGLGFSFTLPIFDRFATRSAVQRAQIQYENAQLELQGLRQDVALQVRQAYNDYLTMAKTLDVTQKSLEAANLALQAEQERYNLGASTLVELTQARAAYTQAATERTRAIYNFLFQKGVIEYYQGALDPTRAVFE